MHCTSMASKTKLLAHYFAGRMAKQQKDTPKKDKLPSTWSFCWLTMSVPSASQNAEVRFCFRVMSCWGRWGSWTAWFKGILCRKRPSWMTWPPSGTGLMTVCCVWRYVQMTKGNPLCDVALQFSVTLTKQNNKTKKTPQRCNYAVRVLHSRMYIS